ncbi:T9SS type A sorting domain-containing protein [Bacteroidota bacterium]
MLPPGTVSEADQVSLMFYLENGGNLYMESADLGKDLKGTVLLDYLGIAYKGDGGEDEISHISGNDNLFMAGINYSYLGGEDAHLYIDHITAEDGVELMYSEDSKTRMIAFDSANYKTISSSVVLGAFAGGDSLNTRAYLVSQIVDYFNDNITIGVEENGLNEMLASITTYPNPFISQINIKYDVLQDEQISIRIYNLNGRLVKELVNNKHTPGTYEVIWNAIANGVPSGLYFYKIQSGQDVKSGKMIFKAN